MWVSVLLMVGVALMSVHEPSLRTPTAAVSSLGATAGAGSGGSGMRSSSAVDGEGSGGMCRAMFTVDKSGTPDDLWKSGEFFVPTSSWHLLEIPV